MDAAAVVEQVRDGVRRRGIDPLRDPQEVRALVDEAVAALGLEWDDDTHRAATSAFHAVAGFGPLQPYLDDPSVEELWINSPG